MLNTFKLFNYQLGTKITIIILLIVVIVHTQVLSTYCVLCFR